MLDNRKIGELPEITGKMVKVRFRLACFSVCWDKPQQLKHLIVKTNSSDFQSIIRVVFHDRRLQYTEHQQLEGWRWNRPGDRILDLGESISVAPQGPGSSVLSLKQQEALITACFHVALLQISPCPSA